MSRTPGVVGKEMPPLKCPLLSLQGYLTMLHLKAAAYISLDNAVLGEWGRTLWGVLQPGGQHRCRARTPVFSAGGGREGSAGKAEHSDAPHPLSCLGTTVETPDPSFQEPAPVESGPGLVGGNCRRSWQGLFHL